MTLVLQKRYNELQKQFADMASWTEKYQFIVDLGKALPPLPVEKKCTENKIVGCVSGVWLTAEVKNKLIFFYGDSDAVMPKGLIAFYVDFFSGVTPEEILLWDIDIADALKLKQNLTPTRAMAVKNILAKIYTLAKGFSYGTL